jgi:hypothetical protein
MEWVGELSPPHLIFNNTLIPIYFWVKKNFHENCKKKKFEILKKYNKWKSF